MSAAGGAQRPTFDAAATSGAQDLQRRVERVAAKVGEVLERRGLIERDRENAWLALDGAAGALEDVLGHSITYRIAVGPRAGPKLFTLQTVSPRPKGSEQARAGGTALAAVPGTQAATVEPRV